MSTLKILVGDLDHIQGDPDAPCTLVEYGDYQCPHCGHAYPVVKQLQEYFGKRLRFVYRNFPLTRIHPQAEAAAQTAEFAADHGRFWEMHDLIFENQERLSGGLFTELADELGLDSAELQKALEDNKYERRVQMDFTGGVRSGVNGTPTFFINGERYDDLKDYPTLVRAIEKALAR